MKRVITASIFLFSISLFSQQLITDGFSVATAKQSLDFSRGYEALDKDVIGTPYIVETFLPANVEGYEGFFLLRYNAAKDEMEFEKDGRKLSIAKKENMLVTFVNTKKQYRVLVYNLEKESFKGYLVPLKEDDKISLYKKEYIKLIPKRESSNAYTDDTPAHYELAEDTYFINKDNATNPFPRKKKELLKMFPNKVKEINVYLKANDISFSKEYDLTKLVTFLNTL